MDKNTTGTSGKDKRHLSFALFAHVDGGKTTLSEALLCYSGKIDKAGRVDHRDSYFDTFNQERTRGITIFSKQAELFFKKENLHMTLLDTPGHVDFAAETERIMDVLDYAVLIINGREGVQSHTKTLWELLDRYKVPRFVFVNKMDIAFSDRETIMNNIKENLSEGCVDYEKIKKGMEDGCIKGEEILEELSFCYEKLMNEYLENECIQIRSLKHAIKSRKVIPCCFGSALKNEGIDQLTECIGSLSMEESYPERFGAKVYKISTDNKGNRLTFMKLTGGGLKVRDTLMTGMIDEKVSEIRIYSGTEYETVTEAVAGDFVAVTGLKYTYAGQGLGKASKSREAYVKPLLRYEVVCPDKMNKAEFVGKLKEVQDEIPELNLTYNSALSEISVQIMGKIQLEVLSQLIMDRYGFRVEFRKGKVIYQETVTGTSMAIGHFEPLRHYAEAVLLMEPGKRGEGITFESNLSEDIFELNFQRLVKTHIFEKEHKGVLIGAPLTDVKFTLISGKAHKKHTVGGDFREAVYRAVRNGLMKNTSCILEPYYDFVLEVPKDSVGRAMSDLGKMSARFTEPVMDEETARLEGSAPAVKMMDYSENIAKYTGGKGNIILRNGGYDICHNQEELIEMTMYDPVMDADNSPDSVFCSHGTGIIVPWDQVDGYISTTSAEQIKAYYKSRVDDSDEGCSSERGIYDYPYDEEPYYDRGVSGGVLSGGDAGNTAAYDKELEQIFERTYGKKKDRTYIHKQVIRPRSEKIVIEKQVIKDSFIIVDGYNLIFAWDELKSLAKKNLDSARDSLLEILGNYQGFTGCKMVVVFDAYKIKGNIRKSERVGEIDVVYTGEGETADSYIEKLTNKVGKDYYVQVATSDNLEQQVILGHGAHRISARGFKEEVNRIDGVISQVLEKYNKKAAMNTRRTIGDSLKAQKSQKNKR